MGGGGRGDVARVCVITGSESGNTRGAMRVIIKNWAKKGSNPSIGETDFLDGGVKSVEKLKELASKYDVLIVATSSYGAGEPPDNLLDFFNLLVAQAAGKVAAAGEVRSSVGRR